MKKTISIVLLAILVISINMPIKASACTVNETTSSFSYKTTLSLNEQSVYDSFLLGISNKSKTITFENLDTNTIKTIYEFVRLDNPQLYYIPRNFKILRYDNGISELSLEYELFKNKNLEALTEDFVTKLNSETNQYLKAKMIYEYIINNSTYSNDNKGIYSMIVSGYGNCEGYSELFKYLCDKSGLNAITVTGASKGTPHQWNMVEINKEWYHVDVTWGDPIDGQLTYNYFCKNYEDIKKTHAINNEQIIPTSNSTKEDYFTKNNLIIASNKEVETVLSTACSINPKNLSVKFEKEADFIDFVSKIDVLLPEIINKISKQTMCKVSYYIDDKLFIVNIYIN